MPKAKENRLKDEAGHADIDGQEFHFVIEPPYRPGNWLPEAPAYLHSAMRWAIQEAGIADSKHKVRLNVLGSDLSIVKREDLRRRIHLVLELEKGNRKRVASDTYLVDLTPPKSRRIKPPDLRGPRAKLPEELTNDDVSTDPRQMRDNRSKTNTQSKSSLLHPDPLSILHQLARPKSNPKPQEILNLEEVLATAGKVPAGKKQKFVDDVNAIVHRANYCFQIEPDKAISRKLYLNLESSRDGDIQFQMTKGGLRGFVRAEYKLIPYSR